jgi:hypothetical protein
MATPTNLPAAAVAGDILTASYVNNLRGAFRVLQVVYAQTTTAVGSSSATPVTTGLTLSITPQATTNKILVFFRHSMYMSAGATEGALLLLRGATTLQTFTGLGYSATGGAGIQEFSSLYLDSPASISALTYSSSQYRAAGAGSFNTQINSNPGTMVAMEISA